MILPGRKVYTAAIGDALQAPAANGWDSPPELSGTSSPVRLHVGFGCHSALHFLFLSTVVVLLI